MRSFADLPDEIERIVLGGERVVLVLLDAFGRRFLDRYAESHPLLSRLLHSGEVRDLQSQFPSTTAAHVTTMHTGLPVWDHGLYEWNVYEPALDAVITPLRFNFAGDRAGDTLLGAGLDPRSLVPDGPTFYERLAASSVQSFVYQPSAFSPSTYDTAVTRGADLRPYASLSAAVAEAIDAVASVRRGYAYVYDPQIDAAGHIYGPTSTEFEQAVMTALDAVSAGLYAAPGVRLLVTADHGQVDIDPAATLWLDELWPPLTDLLRLRPAGSARDVFLHIPPAEVDTAITGLRSALGASAEVRAVADLLADGLFGPSPSPALLDRLATVCILPEPGRMAWLRSAIDIQQHFRGHHGGLDPHETATYLASLPLTP